ncbi:MAG: hypothetical protein ABR562_04265 [Thermoplasmatota archaeon]|nr:hypothetical protein [Halobacteriales archaeon]
MAPDTCMFCHEGLDLSDDAPENLAFLAHLETRQACEEGFAVWSSHMERDFQG